MTPELESLWRAQGLDRALLGVRERLGAFPARHMKVDQAVASAKAQMAAAEDRGKASSSRRDAEKTAESLAEQERKFQIQLTQVKKNEEYAALLHEIASAQKKRGELETFVLEKMEQETAVVADAAKAKSALAEAEKIAKAERAHRRRRGRRARRGGGPAGPPRRGLAALPAVLRALRGASWSRARARRSRNWWGIRVPAAAGGFPRRPRSRSAAASPSWSAPTAGACCSTRRTPPRRLEHHQRELRRAAPSASTSRAK